ncbi:MAG: DUF6751 family protein, partial [Gemmiger sp.]
GIMLNATQTITVIHHENTPADSYVCRVIRGASWYSQLRAGTDVTTNGFNAARVYKVRIPAEAAPGLVCEAGDRVCPGALQDVTGAQFAALPRTHGGFTVLDVHPNLNGAFPHYYIEGG